MKKCVNFVEISPKRKSPRKPCKVFLFSGMEDNVKSKYNKIVKKMGGKVQEVFSEKCTHIIVSQWKLTEKFLYGLAGMKSAGKINGRWEMDIATGIFVRNGGKIGGNCV